MTTANPDPATPFFTIVTATRNAAATLPSTLDSVSGQSYAAVEHIVVDGASTDGTQDLLRGRGGARLRWISEPDRNIAHAFNKGVEMAAGNVTTGWPMTACWRMWRRACVRCPGPGWSMVTAGSSTQVG